LERQYRPLRPNVEPTFLLEFLSLDDNNNNIAELDSSKWEATIRKREGQKGFSSQQQALLRRSTTLHKARHLNQGIPFFSQGMEQQVVLCSIIQVMNIFQGQGCS
jgi:hypothetical protein